MIPRPIAPLRRTRSPVVIDTVEIKLNNNVKNKEFDRDSLNDDDYQTPPSMFHDEAYNKDQTSPTSSTKSQTMMITIPQSTSGEQTLVKKKKKTSTKRHHHSTSSSERRRRQQHSSSQREGRHTKSKPPSSSTINDLSSSSASSSSSTHSSSIVPLRKKSRPYRLASPARVPTITTTSAGKIPSISDDSLSEANEIHEKYRRRRPRSSIVSSQDQQSSSSRRSSRFESPPPAASVYLIELTNSKRPTNAYGLTKTITYVWKSSKAKPEPDLNVYPRYSIEQVPPVADHRSRRVPLPTRQILLQRGKADHWQNINLSSDSILASSCQKHTGSASNLLLTPSEARTVLSSSSTTITTNETRPRSNTAGHIISVTTTKRVGPSFLNRSKNTQWNVAGDGKQLKYSNIKWHSVDQLPQKSYIPQKHRRKQQQHPVDSATDTTSSSEQHNRSAPPILQQEQSYIDIPPSPTPEIHEATNPNRMADKEQQQQTDSIVPDYPLFHREINGTSSPILSDEQHLPNDHSLSSSSSSRIVKRFATIIDEFSSPPPPPPPPPTIDSKPSQISYASTDEDVDELNSHCSEEAEPSATIQTYRDKLAARLFNEQSTGIPPPTKPRTTILDTSFRSRIFSTELSQATLDSGVDMSSEQQHQPLSYQPNTTLTIDEQSSEETADQNDLFALSDDSLLDVEAVVSRPPIASEMFSTQFPSPHIQIQRSSITDESDEPKSYATAIGDLLKIQRGNTNTSDVYYSAESELNTSNTDRSMSADEMNGYISTNRWDSEVYRGYELENVTDEDDPHPMKNDPTGLTLVTETMPSSPPPIPPQFNFQLPSFGDWIDQAFTAFLTENTQLSNEEPQLPIITTPSQSTSSSRSSSIMSIHGSQTNFDNNSSSSNLITMIENQIQQQHVDGNILILEKNPPIVVHHRRCQSWPTSNSNELQQQQVDESSLKDMSNSSLSSDKIVDFDSYTINRMYEKINPNDISTTVVITNKRPIDDEKNNSNEILSFIKRSKSLTIENGDDGEVIIDTMQSDYLPPSNSNTHLHHRIDDNDENFFLSPNPNGRKMEEEKNPADQQQQQHIEIGLDDNQHSHDSSAAIYLPYDEFEHREQKHTNSHDSLLQSDHYHHLAVNKIDTASSSTDELSTIHQLSSSAAFHSKDSALGMSDENLHRPHSISFDDEIDHHHQQQQLHIEPIFDRSQVVVDDNEIQDKANRNNSDDTTTTRADYISPFIVVDESSPSNNTMICVNDEPMSSSSPYQCDQTKHDERTTSSSSSEQLIPKEKQTGMYYKAFGSSAAIHLAEQYRCEWLQDVTTMPITSVRKSPLHDLDMVNESDDAHLRIVRQMQTIGDDEDEFYLSPQHLGPSSSCPNLVTQSFLHQRDRSYSLTTLDAYTRLDITRETLEQMWLSLLDLAFSDKDDFELGEYKLRHIMGLSGSYGNMNETLAEKSRSHGDIFSSHPSTTSPKPVSKSKSFDISSLIKRSNGSHLTTNPNNNDHDSNSANIGLLQGAAISEPFVDRLPPTITHSDTEQNFIDMDNQSIDSFEQIPPMIDDDDHEQEEETADFNLLEQILDRDHQSPTPPPATAGKEPLNYVFHYPHQTTILDNEDFELESDLSHYFPPAPPPLPPPPPPPPPPSSMHNLNHQLGEQDKQLVLSLGFDNDEATAAAETAALAAAAVQPRDTYTELSLFRPHSLSTIPSSRASQYASSVDSDEVFERERFLTKDTVVVVEYPHEQQLEENHLRISDNDDDAEEGDDERGEIESVFSSPQSRPLSSIQSRPQTPEQNQPSKPATFFDIDYDAWTRSISEPTFYEDLSVQCPEQQRPPFNFGQNISSISVPQYIDHRPLTIDQIEPISIDEPSLAQSISLYDQHLIKIDSPLFIQQSDTNSIDSRTGEDYLEIMDVVPSTTTTTTTNMTTKMNDSTRTSLSSIHDTHLDPNELAYRLARLNTSSGTLSPPKKTLAEELAELGEHRQEQTSEQLFFEGDSLDHSPPPPIDSLVEIAQAIKHTAEIKMADTTVDQLPLLSMGENEKKSSRHDSRTIAREIGDDFTVEQTSPAHTYVLGSPTDTPNNVERLTSIANEIRTINEQNKSPSISSLCMIIEDIHARTNNQHLTGIVRHHQSLPIANLQTLVTELQQTPISKSVTYQRPQRPTHLLIESNKSGDEEELSSSEIPIPASIVSDLQQQLSAYKTVSVPPPARRVSEPPMAPIRYQTQRIDKVCDLEIVKQGNGFKIGYVDRRGTDQRVILTKRIEAGPDIMARNPAIRMPYKGRRILNHLNSAVLYTNGHNSIQEDDKFHHLGDELEVPIIGTNPQHFDESDMVSIDIDGPSTMLNSICESIVITQGSVYTSNAPKIQREKPVSHVVKNVFDQKTINNDTTRLRHVALDQHEEYLLEGSRTPTPLKRDKIEIVDSWHDRTVIEGSSTTWRSPSLSSLKANRNVQPSTSVQHFVTTTEHLPQTVQMRIAPSNETKYRTSQHVHVPEVFDWSNETILQTPKQRPASRDAAHSPIDELILPVVKKQYNTTSTSPLPFTKVDRSCQYSPPTTHELGSQCRFETLTSQTQVSTFEIPGFCTQGGTQTTVFDAAAPTSGPLSPSQPMTLSGPEFIRRLKEQRTKATPLTVTQFNDENYFLPPTENNHLTETTITTMTIHPATLERSADSGILVDDIHQPLQHRRTKANFALQVDIKGSSSDSEDVSEATQRPLVRPPPPPPPPPASNGDRYEHHSELVIHSSSHRRTPGLSTEINASTHRVPHQQPPVTSRDIGTSAGELEQQIVQLRRERAHIIDLLALNWDRSKIWVELTEAKLNYIIGETDALLRSLSFDATPPTSESVKLRMHQYEEDMAELTRQRLAVYRERLEDSKKQLDIKIDELEREKSSIEHGGHLPLLDATHIAFSNIGPAASSHYSTLEHAHHLSPNNKRSQSFLSTSAENLSNVPIQDSIASHPHLLDVSFLTSMPTQRPTGDASLPPRYPRSPRSQPPQRQYYSSIIRPRDEEIYRPIHRPAPRYPPTMDQYDYPRYTTNYPGNLSALQGLSKSQQAILDETDKLVRDSQQLHTESASQFERARESLLSSETPIRLARANLAASRQSPRTFNTNNNNNYLPNDVTLAELFKYEQSLAREAAAARNNNNNTTTTPERPPRSFAHSSSTVSPSPTSSTNTRHHPTAAES